MANKTNEHIEGGIDRVWVGDKRDTGIGQTSRRGTHGNSYPTLRAQNGKMVTISKGKGEVPVGHYRKLGTHAAKRNARRRLREGFQRVGSGERGRIRKCCKESPQGKK